MARWAAAIFALAATVSLLSLVVPHGNDVDEPVAVVLAVLAYPMAAALALGGERVPRWLVHAVLATGTVMVAVGIHTAGTGRVAGSASAFYLWVAMYAAYFFSRRAVAAHLAVVTASYAAVLAIDHESAGPALWIGMTGTAIATAVVVASLAGRLRAEEQPRSSSIEADGLRGRTSRRLRERKDRPWQMQRPSSR